MQHAKLPTGLTIDAVRFGWLPESERENLKGLLLCSNSECNAPAHYRRRSTDGRAASFYSNEHIPDCWNKSPERRQTNVPGRKVPVPAVHNSGEKIKILLNSDGNSPNGGGRIMDSPTVHSALGQQHVPGERDRSTDSRGLGIERLLRSLVSDNHFQDSTQIAVLPDGTEKPLRELCFRADDKELHQIKKNDSSVKHEVVVWGKVYSINPWSSMFWINLHWPEMSTQDIGINIPRDMSDQLSLRYELTHLPELASHEENFYCVVIGQVTEASNTKVLIYPSGHEFIAFANI